MPEKKIRTSKRSSKKRSRKSERFLESDSTAENAGFFNLERADRKLLLTTVGIVILLVFAAHAITIWGEFVYLDLFNLTELRNTRDWNLFWSDLMLNSLVSPLNEPLVKVSLAIDVLSMGIRSPGVFHAINMLLHLANVLLLYFFVRRLGKHADLKTRLSLEPDLVAFASAAIFACHPLACGAISYISARSALLVVFNYLLSLHLFISGFLARDIKNALFLYLFSYLFVLFGIWSGPQAVTIPGAFIALALLLKPRKTTFKSWVMDRPFEFFAQFLVALAVPLVLLLNFNPLVGTGFGLSTLALPQYVATQFKVLFTYTLRCFLVPYGLSLDPPFALASSMADPLSLAGLATVLTAGFFAYRLRDSIIPSFALILFVLSLIPSCFVPHPEYVSITRIYFTMGSLAILSGYYLARFSVLKPMPALAVGVVILLTLTGLSNYRNWQWHKDIRLWQSALSMNPESKRSISMYAWALEFNGSMEEGFKVASDAYKKDKDNVILDLILGTYLVVDKQYAEAYKYFEQGVKLAEKQNLSQEILFKLDSGYAEAAMKTGRFDTAFKYAEKALRIQKTAKLLYIQGVCYLSKDNPHGAFMKLQESYLLDKFNPDLTEPLTRAALGCGTKQLQDLAYNMSKQAYKVHGSEPRMALLRSYASLETGRLGEALKFVNLYLSSQKANAESYYLLYGINKQAGKDKEAELFLKLALASNPNIRKEMRLYLNREPVANGANKATKAAPEPTEKPANQTKN